MFQFLSPKKKKIKASKLFEYLTVNNIFRLNEDGEIIHNGKIIDNSNIVELITHAVQNDKTHPIGMDFFYKTLMKNNIPMKFISNKIGQKIMKKTFFNKNSSWRPPGRLNKV